MSDLTPPLAAKPALLIARLASDSDAEVIACVPAMRRLLEMRSLELNDLAAILAQPERVRISMSRLTGRPLPGMSPRAGSSRTTADTFSRTSDFVGTMARRLVMQGEPSPRQAEWLRGLYARLGGEE